MRGHVIDQIKADHIVIDGNSNPSLSIFEQTQFTPAGPYCATCGRTLVY